MKLLLLVALILGGTFVYRHHFLSDTDGLEGRWKIVSPPDGWKMVPAMDVFVTGDEIQIRAATVVTSRLSYTLDTSERTIDAVSSGKAPQKGRYRLEGDTLTLCVGAEGKPRPQSLDSTDDGAMRWVLERAPQLGQ
jgi:uncharacterized protein (TIGR03067 family)